MAQTVNGRRHYNFSVTLYNCLNIVELMIYEFNKKTSGNFIEVIFV